MNSNNQYDNMLTQPYRGGRSKIDNRGYQTSNGYQTSTNMAYKKPPHNARRNQHLPVSRDAVKQYIAMLNTGGYLERAIKRTGPAIERYDEIPHRLPYKPFKNTSQTIHIGQLKLFLTELQYLTRYLDAPGDQCIMLYAGSSPNHKAAHLRSMFPNMLAVMVDPNEHLVYIDEKRTSYDIGEHLAAVYFIASGVYANKPGERDRPQGNRFNVARRVIQMYDNGALKTFDKDLDADAITRVNKANRDAIARGEYSCIIEFITDVIKQQSQNIKYIIFEDYFTNAMAAMFRDLKKMVNVPMLFNSDIRSNIKDDEEPFDIDILWNNAMQYNWINIMQPTAVMLKYRAPYMGPKDIDNFAETKDAPQYAADFKLAADNGLDMIADYEKNIDLPREQRTFKYIAPSSRYIGGCIYIQAFAGSNSSEARHVADGDYSILSAINIAEYEDRFYYYNRVLRNYGFHDEHAAVLKIAADDPRTTHSHKGTNNLGIDACGDCGLMYRIFADYYEKYSLLDKDSAIYNHIAVLMRALRRNFREHGSAHGNYVARYHDLDEIVDDQMNKK